MIDTSFTDKDTRRHKETRLALVIVLANYYSNPIWMKEEPCPEKN